MSNSNKNTKQLRYKNLQYTTNIKGTPYIIQDDCYRIYNSFVPIILGIIAICSSSSGGGSITTYHTCCCCPVTTNTIMMITIVMISYHIQSLTRMTFD